MNAPANHAIGSPPRGLMQDWPLTVDRIIDHAATWDGAREMVWRDGDLTLRSTYAQLRERARRLSVELARLGVQPGDRVATLAWNTGPHLEAWFAIMGMGAICHTLNPRLFPAQLGYILDHAGDRAVLVDPELQALLASFAATVGWRGLVIVHGDESSIDRNLLPDALSSEVLIASADGEAHWGGFNEETACGLCYTSGTTGNPKGVLYSHRSTVLHMLMTLQPDVFGLSITDVAMPIVPMYHANAWGMPLSAAAVGCKLVLPGARLDGASLQALIEAEGVTFSAGVPTVWQTLLDHLDATGAEIPSLRRVIVGGSALTATLIRRFRERGVEAVQGWGMTETSPIGTHGKLTPAVAALPFEAQLPSRLKQGRPPFGIELKIIVEAGSALPHDGVVRGRLLVRGPTVAAAYYPGVAEPALKGALDPEGYFDTGDVATIDPDGYMAIVDRAKDIIKSGGEWIGSVEIETIVAGHPAVARCAVIGVPDVRWGERPLLVVTMATDVVETPDLLGWMHGRVARWWLPDGLVVIDEMPLGATGKIDKQALRARFPVLPVECVRDA